jgi:hypothetical protein
MPDFIEINPREGKKVSYQMLSVLKYVKWKEVLDEIIKVLDIFSWKK